MNNDLPVWEELKAIIYGPPILCYNKILGETRPAVLVVSKYKLHWLEAVLNHTDKYEDKFYIYTKIS